MSFNWHFSYTVNKHQSVINKSVPQYQKLMLLKKKKENDIKKCIFIGFGL